MTSNGIRTLTNYLELEKQTEKRSLVNYRNLLISYRESFNVLSKTLDFILRNQSSVNQLPTILTMCRLVGTLQSLRILTLKGYYFKVRVLQRNFLESLGLCAYLKDNPEKVCLIAQKKLNVSSSQLFKYSHRIFSEEKNEHLEKIFGQNYADLCNYVHGNLEGTLKGISAGFEDQKENGFEVHFTVPSEPSAEELSNLAVYPIIAILGLQYCFHDILSAKQTKDLMNTIYKGLLAFKN